MLYDKTSVLICQNRNFIFLLPINKFSDIFSKDFTFEMNKPSESIESCITGDATAHRVSHLPSNLLQYNLLILIILSSP